MKYNILNNPILLAGVMLITLNANLYAEQSADAVPTSQYSPIDYYYGAFIAMMVIGWGVVTLIVCLRAIKKGGHSVEEASKPFIIISVVISALFLVNSSQAKPEVIAAAFGLFGSIVGFLFGRTTALGKDVSGASSSPPKPPYEADLSNIKPTSDAKT